MTKGTFTMVGNMGGLLIPRGLQAFRSPFGGKAGPVIVQPRTRTIPLNPAYRTMFQSQQARRYAYAQPGAFPPGMTAEAATQEAITRAQLQAMPRRVQQPPYVTMPASGQSYTFTDSTVSSSTIVLPAVGAFQIVVTFQVPIGRNGVIDAIANQLTVGGFQDGSGNALWFLTINGMVYRGFNNIKAAIGTMSNPGRYEDKKIRIFENDVVQLLIQNVALFAGQGIIQGLLGGYVYPIAEEFESVN